MDNICDFEHVSFVHKKCFTYNTVIKKSGGITVLEYGVKHLPLLPFLVTKYFMVHEKVSANKVLHKSKRSGGTRWITSVMFLEEKVTESGIQTIYTSSHESYLPFYFKPFKKLLIRIADHWSNIVWHEDYEICKSRFLLEKSGFRDGPLCGAWKEIEGIIKYIPND